MRGLHRDAPQEPLKGGAVAPCGFGRAPWVTACVARAHMPKGWAETLPRDVPAPTGSVRPPCVRPEYPYLDYIGVDMDLPGARPGWIRQGRFTAPVSPTLNHSSQRV